MTGKRKRGVRVRLPMLPLAAPLPAECPDQPCVRACRANVLWGDVTDAGSIPIVGWRTLAPVRGNRRITTDDDLEEAASALVRRARALGVTCMWRRIRPGGVTQDEVARVLGMTRQRVAQIEDGARRTIESALLSDGLDENECIETRNETVWPEPASRLGSRMNKNARSRGA